MIGPDPLIRRIFDLVEAGHTFRVRGEAPERRGLDDDRGKPWAPRRIRYTVLKELYADWFLSRAGERKADHDRLIEPERWETNRLPMFKTMAL